jgi:hypothetical protein
MLCGRESLFTNSTRVPGGTVISRGLAPPAVMVIVKGFDDGGGLGDPGLSPPHAHTPTQAASTNALIEIMAESPDYPMVVRQSWQFRSGIPIAERAEIVSRGISADDADR